MKQLKSNLMAVTAIAVAAMCGAPYADAQMVYPTPDTKTLELKGPVKEMTEYRISKKEFFTQEELDEYKRLGQKPPTTSRDFKASYKFDKRGFTTSSREDFIGSDRVTTMTYDAEGRKKSERIDDDGKLHTLYTFSYDSEGMPSNARKVDGDGKVIFTEANRVRRKGDVLIQTNIHTNADGTKSEAVVEFWPNGAMKTFSTSSGTSSMTSTFDSDGTPLTYETSRKGDVRKMRMVKDPSDSDVTLIYATEGDGPEFLMTRTVNDENGNPVRKTDYRPDGTVNSEKAWKYTYDSHGNWTSKTTVKGASYYEKPTEREISYY